MKSMKKILKKRFKRGKKIEADLETSKLYEIKVIKLNTYINNLKVIDEKLRKKVLKIINDPKNWKNINNITNIDKVFDEQTPFLIEVMNFYQKINYEDAKLLIIGLVGLGICLDHEGKKQIASWYKRKEHYPLEIKKMFIEMLKEAENIKKEKQMEIFESKEKIWAFFGYFNYMFFYDIKEAKKFLKFLNESINQNKKAWEILSEEEKKEIIKGFIEIYEVNPYLFSQTYFDFLLKNIEIQKKYWKGLQESDSIIIIQRYVNICKNPEFRVKTTYSVKKEENFLKKLLEIKENALNPSFLNYSLEKG